MSWWLRDLVQPCAYGQGTAYACRSKATKEVVNSYNSSCGAYCAKHARARLRELERKEKGS